MTDIHMQADQSKPASLHGRYHVGIVIGLLVSLFVLVAGFNKGLLDFHDFRQSQTALTTYWMLQGGDWFAYETPVVGYPWVIPFELPVFQWISALVSLTGLPLVQSSRLVSWTFFLAFVWLSASTLKRLDFSKTVVLTFTTLLLCSPLYLFWSRTVMIESTANMFGALCLFGLVGYLKAPNWKDGAALFIGLTLCALVKVTTLLSFAAAASAIGVYYLYQHFLTHQNLVATAKRAVFPALAAVIAFSVLLAWLSFADGWKSQNPFGVTLTSAGLSEFNFGTWEQKLSPAVWIEVFLGRAVRDTIGSPVIIIVIGWVIYKTRYMVGPAVLAFGLYILPFMVFTNLHLLHNYYQYANSFFLLLFVAFGVDAAPRIQSAAFQSWSAQKKKNVFLGALVCLQLGLFFAGYWKLLMDDQSKYRAPIVAAKIAEVTKPDEVTFAFGMSWNSILAFLSHRRVITLPDSASNIALQTKDMTAWTGGRRIGAVVDCETTMTANLKPYIAQISKGMDQTFVANCIIYTPKPVAAR